MYIYSLGFTIKKLQSSHGTHTLPPPHKKHFCDRTALEDRKRSEEDRTRVPRTLNVYLVHSLHRTLLFSLTGA